MDGERYLMGAVIRRESGDARFYVHEILTAKEGQTPFKTGTDSKTGGDPGGDYPSVISLLQKVKSVNSGDANSSTRYSLSDDMDETDLPGWDEDNHSKFDQFTDTYEQGTNLIGKAKSIQAAEELKREYGSRANTQSIATKYRQMTTIAEQFSNVYLDGMMGEEPLGKENRTRTYEETQLPTSNHAAVFHRLVIARAGCTAQKRQSIRTTAFNDAI